MGLSLLEFESAVKEIINQKVTADISDYTSVLTRAAGNIQDQGQTFGFLARVNSETNNVEVYNGVALASRQGVRYSDMDRMVKNMGGVPLLDAPQSVIQNTLAQRDDLSALLQDALKDKSFSAAGHATTMPVEEVFTSGRQVVSAKSSALTVKNRIWDDHQHIMADVPELSLKPSDIQLMARFVASMSNMPTFSKMYQELGAVEETREKGSTLYVQKVTTTKRILRYNPAFIAKAIVQDMVAAKVGLSGMENYGGAMASLGYMIGHELLHVIYDHFNADVNQGLKDMQLPPVVNKTNSKALQRVMSNTVPIEELMNNRFMSAMFDMPATNGGYTVPEFRTMDARGNTSTGATFNRITCGRWYIGDQIVFGKGNLDAAKVSDVQNRLKDSGNSPDYREALLDELSSAQDKMSYDVWFPVIFVVNRADDVNIGRLETMPEEYTFFADGTLPLPSFWDLELMVRRAFSATLTDDELVKKKPTYGDARKPDVTVTEVEKDNDAGDAGDQAAPEDTQKEPEIYTPEMERGDVVLDKVTGIYQVVIGVLPNDEQGAQQLLTYPVTRLNGTLSGKIMSAVQGNKDSGVLNDEEIAKATALANVGGSPNAPVRLNDNVFDEVLLATTADNLIKEDELEVKRAKDLRPVYLDVRDEVQVDPNQQQDNGSDEDPEPQPDIEVNNEPDMPPQDDGSAGGGASQDDGTDDEDDDNDAAGGGDANDEDPDDEDDQDASADQSGDGTAGGGTDDDLDPSDDQDGDSTTGDDVDNDQDGNDAAGDNTDGDQDQSGTDSDATSNQDDAADSDGDSPDADSNQSGGGSDQSGDDADADSDDQQSGGGDADSEEQDSESDWDDYLDSLANDMNSSTIGSNDESDDAVDRPDTTQGGQPEGDDADDDSDMSGDSTSGDGNDTDNTDANSDSDADSDADGSDADGDDEQPDTSDMFDRDPDTDEERAKRKEAQQRLKDNLDKMNDMLREAGETMEDNRNEREKNDGELDLDNVRDQLQNAGKGSDAYQFGGGQRADRQTMGLVSLIRKWARKVKGFKIDTEVGHNASKLSRRIKGAWGADDDMPVRRGSGDKALVVIIDASGSLASSARLISKAIAATVFELDKKMGVKYVVPINFDGREYGSGIYTVKELDKAMPKYLKSSGSFISPAYEYLVQLFEGTAKFDKTKYKGDPTQLVIGGVMVISDFDIFDDRYRGGTSIDGDGSPKSIVPARLVKAMNVKGGKLPWLNMCWLTQGARTVEYLYQFHDNNAKKWKSKINFEGMVVENDGTAAMVKLKDPR